MIDRILEPELMDDPEATQQYDAMDHSEVNRRFVLDLLEAGLPGPDILDLGTGTARIPIELCQRSPDCRVMASDAAQCMLEIGRINVAIAGLEHRIELHLGDCKQLPFADGMFDCVISNSLLHHLADPRPAIGEIIRVTRPGGRIFVRDLVRPDDVQALESLVATHAGSEPESAQQLLRQSLHAALTLDEIRSMVADAGMVPTDVQMTSDRHWTWCSLKSG
ncbi:MAG: class I SAM-dependent methyltransferase [Planctomycetota bacterium]|nr:MAG: class I SAM-dependent methyltransferase [Planctomycetota bacterium]